MWDVLIQNATIFDGTGNAPITGDVAIQDGKIAAIGGQLTGKAKKTVDATGQWLMPGLLDIHTHYDLEVEIEPGLPESVRHGTTTVVMSNCSLGIAFGAQRKDGADPIVDCFARVENMPKHILERAAGIAEGWDNSADYMAHLDGLDLGPNVVPMIPHSMLRIEVMGLKASITRDPTPAELDAMCALVEKGMEEGYAGFSTDALPFHYLANDPNRRQKIPTQYGTYKELKRLTSVVRKHDAVWQATPPKDSPPETLRNFMLTSGRFHGKPLKLTAVAAMDIVSNKSLGALGRVLSSILNSKFVDGRFRLQALAAPFKVWSEGAITPLSEEIVELRRLNEPDLEDRQARMDVLDDPEWQREFRAMWYSGKRGLGISRLKRALTIEDHTLTRDLADMYIERAPIDSWAGEPISASYERYLNRKPNEDEVDFFDSLVEDMDEADYFISLLREFDTDLYWYTYAANTNPAVVKQLIQNPKMLPGFSDSGAHITNMAFYDVNLRALQMVQDDGLDAVSNMVSRLTREPAEFFDLDVGVLERGRPADVTIIDPEALRGHDGEGSVIENYRESFEHHQLVNRSDGVVSLVVIGGKVAWEGTDFTDALGKVKMGRALRRVGASQAASESFAAAAE